MTDFQGSRGQEVITCDSLPLAPVHSPSLSHTHTHLHRVVHPPRCHPAPGFRWQANISRLHSWGLLTPHVLWEPAVCAAPENRSLSRPFLYMFDFLRLYQNRDACFPSLCTLRNLWWRKAKSLRPKPQDRHSRTNPYSIIDSLQLDWLPDNKPLNCTPNWQAGKPIHSGADAET